jgi:hypothetical protein
MSSLYTTFVFLENDADMWLPFLFYTCRNIVDLGGLVVSVLATGPKVRGFDPDREFLRVIKIRSTTSFGGEVKPSVPCRRFTACKRTFGHEEEPVVSVS